MTEYSPAEFDVNFASPPGLGEARGFDAQGFMVDMGSLYDFLSRLEDRRNCRGIRYKLVNILAFVVLAKLAGEDRVTGISEWVWHRKEALAKAMGLKRPQAPTALLIAGYWEKRRRRKSWRRRWATSSPAFHRMDNWSR